MQAKGLTWVLIVGLFLVFVGATTAKIKSQVRFAKRLRQVEQPVPDTAGTAATARATLQAQLADSLISFAHRFMGTRYQAGGSTASGFDCSGFTSFVYQHFGFPVPHGSVSQVEVGEPVPLGEARKGDLLIFTGTNPEVREPGHVGIVITDPGGAVKFIHSSSNGGVKISQVDNTRYALRFLQVRRVIGAD